MESLQETLRALTPERWRQLKSLFERAQELEHAERLRFVREACGGDAVLENGLRSLLEHDLAATSLLSGPVISQQRIAEYISAGTRTFQNGEVIAGRFTIERFIAEGGMGEVYAAHDLDLGERVALKTLRPALSSNEQLLRQFKQEIQIARKVTHRNVARVFDLFWHDATSGNESRAIAFLTMELLEGETLANRIRHKGPMPEAEALSILEQVVMGLTAAHSAGVVHRDLKSGNILLVEQPDGLRAVITDFGLACPPDDPEVDADGQRPIAGTIAYMAPEQFDGNPITAGTDIYALGVVMFEMLTGRLPFSGSFLERRRDETVPSPRELVPDIDPHWEAAILWCLEPEPGDRPHTAEAVLRRIRSRRVPSRRVLLGAATFTAAAVAAKWIWLTPKPRNAEAVKSFKRGQEFVRRRNEEGLRNAVHEFGQAINLEPSYTEAWVGLADAYSAMANFNIMDPKDALSKAKQAALRAVELDRGSGKALGVLGYVTSISTHDWRGAERYFRRAVAADPKDPTIRLWYGAYLGKLGRSPQAIEQIMIGLGQDPSSLILNQQLAVEYFRARRFREYYDQARELVRLQPFESTSHLALARALEWLHRYAEALHECDEASKLGDPVAARCFRGSIEASRGNLAVARTIASTIRQYWNDHSFETIQVAILYCGLGEHKTAVDLLNAGYDREDSTVLAAPTNPYLEPLRDDPGYKRFLDRIGWTGTNVR